jgi:FtsH-binding integral membrane protein
MFYSTGVSRSAKDINTAMGRVYAHMAGAVIVSMITAMIAGSSAAIMALLFGTALKWVIIFAPLVAILAISFGFEKMSKSTLQLCLYGFAVLMGMSFSTIFVVYNLGSIVSAFMGAAVLFIVMSGYGYFTKRSLDSLGSYLFVGLIAVIVASVINIFLMSSVFQMVISAIAIIVFLGLTAYDTQKIREMVSYDNDGKAEVMGALSLYLDFINLFLSLLQLFGGRKD